MFLAGVDTRTPEGIFPHQPHDLTSRSVGCRKGGHRKARRLLPRTRHRDHLVPCSRVHRRASLSVQARSTSHTTICCSPSSSGREDTPCTWRGIVSVQFCSIRRFALVSRRLLMDSKPPWCCCCALAAVRGEGIGTCRRLRPGRPIRPIPSILLALPHNQRTRQARASQLPSWKEPEAMEDCSGRC